MIRDGRPRRDPAGAGLQLLATRPGRPRDSQHARDRARRVYEFQRTRLLRAAAEVAAERGYERMTVAAIIARAGVSRKTFYELFYDRDDCFLAVFEDAFQQMTLVFARPYEGDGEWRERLRNALAAVLALLERQRNTGTLALSYLRCAGPRRAEPREQALETLRSIVEDGRSHAKRGHKLSPVTPEAIVGGALAVIHARLQSGDLRLMNLVNPLMSTIVLPYLGPAAAAKELSRKPPKRANKAPPPPRDPMRELGIRPTYRTARTLAVIAEAPGRSNVEVAALVGISDQGQISRLLSRLARLGLVASTRADDEPRGEHAWHLTADGADVEAAIGLKPTPA